MACCCSLAGTAACDSCRNRPNMFATGTTVMTKSAMITYVPERTCKLERHGSLADWPEMVCWSCSECHFGWHHDINDKQFSYCPNCGAKVVM